MDKPSLPLSPTRGGLVVAAPAPTDVARSTTIPTGTGKVAETPRPGCPTMPVGPPGLAEHRDHLVVHPSRSLLAMVARSVTLKEIMTTPAASQSPTNEAAKLVQKGAWDPKGVREWQHVADEARKKGDKAHVGRVFGIVIENTPSSPRITPTGNIKVDWSSRATK